MRVLAIVHQRDAGPGVFTEAIDAAAARLDTWEPWAGPPARSPAAYDAVLAFGGAMHPDQGQRHDWMEGERVLLAELVERGVPTLAVCLGAQLLAGAGGGAVRRATRPEIGWCPVELTPAGAADPVLGPLGPGFEALEWHSYACAPPPEATALARNATCLQAYRIGERAWGIQFHAEVTAADLDGWIEDYRSDEDAVAIGLDPDALRRESEAKIGAWNDLGRGLCERFLATAGA
ncbi:MAG TPA: type 1 glutamine amidotransferase [Solirubrobacteraceae bacterium]|nr:type 1 glutamine amidotransferase [Solirubrobacteraceae bacterium]